MMMPATLSIIRVTFTDERERGFAIGIWGSVSAGGAGLGPIVGGLLLEHFWWGSVFLINLPIAIIAFALTLIYVPKHAGNTEKKWDLYRLHPNHDRHGGTHLFHQRVYPS